MSQHEHDTNVCACMCV